MQGAEFELEVGKVFKNVYVFRLSDEKDLSVSFWLCIHSDCNFQPCPAFEPPAAVCFTATAAAAALPLILSSLTWL